MDLCKDYHCCECILRCGLQLYITNFISDETLQNTYLLYSKSSRFSFLEQCTARQRVTNTLEWVLLGGGGGGCIVKSHYSTLVCVLIVFEAFTQLLSTNLLYISVNTGILFCFYNSLNTNKMMI